MSVRRPNPLHPRHPGPRPLPLHLAVHAWTLLTSQAALPFWKNGLLPWKPSLAEAAAELGRSLDAAGPDGYERLGDALLTEALARHEDFLKGVQAYRRHPYRRTLPAPPALWAEGTTRLLDYRQPDRGGGPAVLVVPSLVNRAYVLDLRAGRSLMRDMAARGMAPFLVDWDAPGDAEKAFTLTDYVARLERAFDAVAAETGRRPALLGYCMGGMLALALAQRRAEAVSALVLLATPWDFHAGGRAAQGRLMGALAGPLGGIVDALGEVPVDVLQTLFAGLDPSLVVRKFSAFGRLPPRSARARDFVALEEWANDGVPLAGPVARECLLGWYGGNDPAQGRWRIAGRPVRPGEVASPALVVAPARDRIVPPQSVKPLAMEIPGARPMATAGGHVGMLLGQLAKTEVYEKIAKWLVLSAVQ